MALVIWFVMIDRLDSNKLHDRLYDDFHWGFSGTEGRQGQEENVMNGR
jgi:hypothetical protein